MFSLLFLICCSCGSLSELENFSEKPTENIAIAQNSYFSDSANVSMYKAKISVYGNDLSGIFVIRKMKDSLWRTALISEFGSTLLDISFNKTFYEVNYSIEQFDKKYILSTLINDFRLLVLPKRKVVQSYENPETLLLKTKTDEGFIYYFLNKKVHRLVKLIRTNGRKKKVTVYFSDFKETQPKEIRIEHHNIRLDIFLNAIPQTNVD